ncbi:hypothetical protein BH09BAC2_BH09BAC2_23740 [soil metagenome]
MLLWMVCNYIAHDGMYFETMLLNKDPKNFYQ